MQNHLAARKCIDCGLKKSGMDFAPIYEKGGRRIIGRQSRCKACTKLINQQAYKERKEQKQMEEILSTSWQERIVKKQKKAWRNHLKVIYGITPNQYDSMFQLQHGLCAICRQPERTPEKRLAVDHDHTTGILRGLLCTQCNLALGLFDDDDDRLERAVTYLRFHRAWGDV